MERIVTLLVALAILGPPLEAKGADDRDPCGKAAREVRAVAEGIISADNVQDIQRVLHYYAADAILLPPGEQPVMGRETIKSRYEELFSKFNPEIEGHVEEACVGDGLAFVRGRNGGRLVSREGGSSRMLNDVYIMVLRRDTAGDWRISHLMWHAGDLRTSKATE